MYLFSDINYIWLNKIKYSCIKNGEKAVWFKCSFSQLHFKCSMAAFLIILCTTDLIIKLFICCTK